MSVKERIMMLRLMEKLRQHPDFGKTLGTEVNCVNKHSKIKWEPKSPARG